MKTIMIVLFGVFLAIPGRADDEAVKKYRNYTPEQLRDLSQEKLNSEVPMIYTMAARQGLSEGSGLLFCMQLNSLMYSGLHDYGSAVKAFQSDLGDSPTGKLTVWQISQLEQRSEMQKLSQVSFPNQYSSYIDKDYASVQGTSIIVDDKMAYPINHVRVSCIRSENVCQVDQIDLTIPNEKSFAQTYGVMEEGTDTYTILRWDNDSIESYPLGASSNCRQTTLSFNFKTKEFYFITKNAGGDCKALGYDWKLTKPRISQIVDGKKIIEDEFAKIDRAAFQALSSDFRKKAEALEVKSTAK